MWSLSKEGGALGDSKFLGLNEILVLNDRLTRRRRETCNLSTGVDAWLDVMKITSRTFVHQIPWAAVTHKWETRVHVRMGQSMLKRE